MGQPVGSQKQPEGLIDYDTDIDRPPTICVDLDGTLLEYDRWRGADHFGEPLPEAKEALQELKACGWRVIIFTTRGDAVKVARALEGYGIPFDYVNHNPDQPPGADSGKPMADVYLDDRALRFVSWELALEQIGTREAGGYG